MNVKQMVAVLRAEIQRLQSAIDALEGGRSTGRVRGKRRLSADARARIAAAQRKRWAKFKAGKKAA